MKKIIVIALLLASLITSMSWGADFNKGLAAYHRGDFTTALREWTPLAKQGNADAQYNLGLMYVRGQGVPQDDKMAMKYFAQAAEQGDAEIQYKVGLRYHLLALRHYIKISKGVTQGDKMAVRLLTQAAEWYTQSAEQGQTTAQYKLGVMYTAGDGVTQDDNTAVKWYTRAAEQGHADSQYGLSIKYAFGRGVIEDYLRALMWANIARYNGFEDAEKFIEFLVERMTPEQIAKAQDLAQECLVRDYKGC